MDFSNVVSSTIYLRDVKDEDPVVSLYGTFSKDTFPARTTLQQNFDMKSEDSWADFFYCRETAASLRRVCAGRFVQNQSMDSSNVFPGGAAGFAVAVSGFHVRLPSACDKLPGMES